MPGGAWQAGPNNSAAITLKQRCALVLQPLSDRETALALCSALQQRAREAGVSLRPPPPEPTTCCGRGCNGCVWEGYYNAVNYWREEALRLLPA